MEEEWVLFGESGSDADTVQFEDSSDDDSASDKSGEMSFTTVQIGGNRRAADTLDSSVESPISGENKEEEEEESNGAHGYFDLNLPALAGSKPVFGASGDSFDPNLAASILSMGNVGYDTTDSDADDDEQPDLDDIDMESIGPADGDGIEHPERRPCAHCANMDTDQGSDAAAEVVVCDDIDTESSDPAESDYSNNDAEHPEFGYGGYDDFDTESSNADMEKPRRLDDIDLESICAADDDDIDTDSDDGTESSDAEESDYSDDCTESDYSDDGTESSDTEESYYSDESTEELFDAPGITGGGDDTEKSYFAVTPQRSLAASRPPTAPHLFFPNRAEASIAASLTPNAPLFFRHRDGASTAASRPPGAPHLYFRKRTVTN